MESHSQPKTIAGTGTAVLECPQCLSSCSPRDDECASCGFLFRPKRAEQGSDTPRPELDHTIHFDPVSNRRYTQTITVPLGSRTSARHRRLWMLTNLLLGLVAAVIGGLMAYAMPFGFECGFILVFVGALFILNVYLTSEVKRDRVDGCCPNCGTVCSITVGKSKGPATGRCPDCRSAFNHIGNRFESA